MSDVKIYDISGKEPVLGTISADEVPAALESGKFTLPQGPVRVVDPDGQLGEIDASEAQAAFAQGFRPASAKDIQEFKYGSGMQQAIAGVEGLASGVAGPLATMAEKALGVPEKDILGRRQVNPGTHLAGEAVGLLSPIGEGALLAKAGAAGAKALGATGKITGTAARGAIEAALFQTGDETSRMLLNDPEQSAETALANVGVSALLGGGIGAAFGTTAKGWTALQEGPAGKFVNDFKSRIKMHLDNPAPGEAIAQEMGALHASVRDAEKSFGLKNTEIRNLLKEAPAEKINESVVKMTGEFEDLINKTRAKPDMVGVTQKLEQDMAELNQALRNGPAEYFDALNTLKRKMYNYSTAYQPEFSPGANFKGMAKGFWGSLKDHLEDGKTWGAAGERQKSFNAAFSKLQAPLDEFERSFTTTLNGEKVIDPGKLETYLNQVGKTRGEIKQDKVANFVSAAEKFNAELNKTHAGLGLEAVPSLDLHHTMETLKDVPAGAKLADALIKKGLANMMGSGAGAAGGAVFGHPIVGALIGQHALSPVLEKVLPSIMRPLLEKNTSGAGLKAAIEMGMATAKGASKLERAAKAVFNEGTAETAKVINLDRLNKQVQEFKVNPEMLLNNQRKIADYMPNQEMALSAASVRIMQHLAKLAPSEQPLAPLSPARVPSAVEEARYKQALMVAEDPLVILDKLGKGTLTQTNLDDLKVMYPKLHATMSQKLIDNAINAQAKGKQIPYKTKVGMTRFLGTSFDPSLQPPNILAAQTASSAQSPREQAPQDQSIKHPDKLDKLAKTTASPSTSREASKLAKR